MIKKYEQFNNDNMLEALARKSGEKHRLSTEEIQIYIGAFMSGYIDEITPDYDSRLYLTDRTYKIGYNDGNEAFKKGIRQYNKEIDEYNSGFDAGYNSNGSKVNYNTENMSPYQDGYNTGFNYYTANKRYTKQTINKLVGMSQSYN